MLFEPPAGMYRIYVYHKYSVAARQHCDVHLTYYTPYYHICQSLSRISLRSPSK